MISGGFWFKMNPNSPQKCENLSVGRSRFSSSLLHRFFEDFGAFFVLFGDHFGEQKLLKSLLGSFVSARGSILGSRGVILEDLNVLGWLFNGFGVVQVWVGKGFREDCGVYFSLCASFFCFLLAYSCFLLLLSGCFALGLYVFRCLMPFLFSLSVPPLGHV